MSAPLENKTIVVALTGGIACYKGAELVRLLITAGARVRVMMTAGAREFITPLTLQALSGEPVATDTFSLTQESEIGHIRLADTADAIVVAPATANVIARAAHGMADDLVTTVLLATRAPVLFCPSMNVHMYENAAVDENLATLRRRGHRVVEPDSGFLACGYEGAGRLADLTRIVAEVARALTPATLAGKRVLVSAGPNRERIDPVRFVSNRSTGKMGYALAAAAWRRGAEVTLVSGPTPLEAPHGVEVRMATTAAEMHDAVQEEFRRADVLLMAAAVADYRPARPAAQKLKKGAGPLKIELERTTDILASLAPRKGKRVVVGFAAETENVEENARRKLREKKLDMVVVNDVSRSDAGFEVDTNAVVMIDAAGSVEVPLASKDEVAGRILDRVEELLRRRGKDGRAASGRRRA